MDSGSLVLRSNIEAGLDTKIVVMPYLDDINKLTGFGMSAGFDVSRDFIASFNLGIGLASYQKESFALTFSTGIGHQLVPVADVYLNLSITGINDGLTQEELEELLEGLDNMQLGGF